MNLSTRYFFMIATETQVKLADLPYEAWEDSMTTLHLYFQIIGKIKQALNPWKNHWWHIPLFVDPRGLNTGPIPYNDIYFQIQFDFIEHQLKIESSDGRVKVLFFNEGLAVAEFYTGLFELLAELGIHADIKAKPYKMNSEIPFAEDYEHKSYDREYVTRYWGILLEVDKVFKEFSGYYYGKTCPVQLYWHSMDLTVTRFSGKRLEPMENASDVEREAYSHEVISFGFWPGDPDFKKAAFYSYAYPVPEGYDEKHLAPNKAYWQERNGSPMALYEYADWQKAPDPRNALLEFLKSAFDAGAKGNEEWFSS